jgi:hypothetical protein
VLEGCWSVMMKTTFIGRSFPRNRLQLRADVAKAPPTADLMNVRLDILFAIFSGSSGIITFSLRIFKKNKDLTKIVRNYKLST